MINTTCIEKSISSFDDFTEVLKAGIERVYSDDYEVFSHKVMKNNSNEYTAITIRNRNEDMGPTIYIDSLYEDYLAGKAVEEIVKTICETYEKSMVGVHFDVNAITEYEKIKSHICVRLINRDKNNDLLKRLFYVNYRDLAMTFYIAIDLREGVSGGIQVTKELFEGWGDLDEKEFIENARMNTQRKYPGCIITMKDIARNIVAGITNQSDETKKKIEDEIISADKKSPMFIATNSSRTNGASVMLYDDFLEEFYERIGGEFFILPSSIHELIFVPDDDYSDPKHLVEMVREVNSTELQGEEILSDNIYFYTWCEKSKKREVCLMLIDLDECD